MTQHAVIVGGGHNGLVAANYLARAGWKVTVLEARASFGGVVGRYEYLPGYAASITNSPGSFDGTVLHELELHRWGLRFERPEVTLLHPMRESLFVGWRSPEAVARQMDGYAPGESRRHRQLVGRLDALGAAAGVTFGQRPRSLAETLVRMDPSWRDEFERALIAGSLTELLDESLESDEVKSLMMMLALNGQLVAPTAAGSAFGLLLRPIARASATHDPLGSTSAPLRGSVGLPVGSMAAIVDALVASAHARGVELRPSARVCALTMNDDQDITGIELESGEHITDMDAVIVTLEPSQLAGLLPNAWRSDIERPAAPTGSAFKIALALDGLPEIAHAPAGVPQETLFAAQFRIGPDPGYITRAVEDGIAGLPSENPLIWGLVPSLTSPMVAPQGRHLMSLNVWHAPHALGAAYWRQHGREFADRCIAQVDRAFPGLRDRIVDRVWLGPHDIEAEFGLTGSNITHGDMLPVDMLNGRPGLAFAEALEASGVVLGGAGTWPGGYVTGVPGRNAAMSLLTNQKEFAQ